MSGENEEPLWRPSAPRIATSRLAELTGILARRTGEPVLDYGAAHRISVERPEVFWGAVWDDCRVVAGNRGEEVLAADDGTGELRWFPHATLNLAENLLARRDEGPALVYRGDGVTENRVMSWAELRGDVSVLARALSRAGVAPGDVVATWMPNVCETVVVMLATTSLGAVFAPVPPDLGADDVLERLATVDPKVLFVADARRQGSGVGSRSDPSVGITGRVGCPEVVVVVPGADSDTATPAPPTVLFEDFRSEVAAGTAAFEAMPFDHPAVITFVATATGRIRPVPHTVGGLVLKYLVEHQYHCDVRAGDRVLVAAPVGSPTWTWSVTALASGAAVVLVDGESDPVDPRAVFHAADDVDATLLAAPVGLFDAACRAGLRPASELGLAGLRTVVAFTGGPSADVARWVYDAVKSEVQFAPMLWDDGLAGAVTAGDPTGPVWAGATGRPALGVAVEVADGALRVHSEMRTVSARTAASGCSGPRACWVADGHIALEPLPSPVSRVDEEIG